MIKAGGWIGVDLDGTLAQDLDQPFDAPIGPPIPEMLERVRAWLEAGHEVRIVTARVSFDDWSNSSYQSALDQRRKVRAWTLAHLGRELEVTCRKDRLMAELWDDRAVQVVRNSGARVGDHYREHTTDPPGGST